MNLLRPARFAGSWYPERASELYTALEGYCPSDGDEAILDAKGIVAPHAGYVYSGEVAGAVYSRIRVPELCLILAPNHTGFGPALSLYPEGVWETPLGAVPVSDDLNQELLVAVDGLQEDLSAHENEHAAELQLPFLRFRNASVKFSSIVIGTRDDAVLERLGKAIAEIAAVMGQPILVVASSDLNHHENQKTTERKDQLALDVLLRLDPAELSRVVRLERISMCGAGPAIAMLHAAQGMGATKAHLLRHETSGRIRGDYDRVVGYGAVAIT